MCTNDEFCEFGLLVKNDTLCIKFNGVEVSPPEKKNEYLLLEYKYGQGATLIATNEQGLNERWTGNDNSGYRKVNDWPVMQNIRDNSGKIVNDSPDILTSFKTIVDACNEENAKGFVWKDTDLFENPDWDEDGGDYDLSHLYTSNSKRFILQVCKKADIAIPKKFWEDHIDWIKGKWYKNLNTADEFKLFRDQYSVAFKSMIRDTYDKSYKYHLNQKGDMSNERGIQPPAFLYKCKLMLGE